MPGSKLINFPKITNWVKLKNKHRTTKKNCSIAFQWMVTLRGSVHGIHSGSQRANFSLLHSFINASLSGSKRCIDRWHGLLKFILSPLLVIVVCPYTNIGPHRAECQVCYKFREWCIKHSLQERARPVAPSQIPITKVTFRKFGPRNAVELVKAVKERRRVE